LACKDWERRESGKNQHGEKNMSNRYIAVALFLISSTCLARAQGQAEPTVSAQGVVELRRPPDILRVQVELLAKGKDLPEALAKLKERRAAVEQYLHTLGLSKESLVFAEPAPASAKTEQQRQIEAMVMQRMAAQGKAPTKSKDKLPAVVSSMLKAELPLKASDPESLLIQSAELEEKIKAADLGGTKDLKQLSPQEEEIAAEAAALGQASEDPSEPKRGAPLFIYVSRISDADRTKALADAFQLAKAEAGRLARAAGAELGPLHHVESVSTAGADDSSGSANPYQMQAYMQWRQTQEPASPSSPEASGPLPKRVIFRVAVSASFRLKESPQK
jgi:uncharacterized protein YggE